MNQTTNGVGYTLGDDSAVDPETKESKPVGKGAEVTFSEDGRTLVKAPEDVTSFDVPDGVTRIGSNAFRECTQLTRITLPDSVKEIGTCAFWNCTALTSISFPAGLREIHGDSFAGCTSLTEIEIPEECAEVVRKAYPRWFQEADPQ
ncbi:MAG: leucine-rich repeat domain-containing protein [Lentisphaeria bacterium]|nr:leucine-rich repeat domain-containing protein [Lentisphaeria bacterium]